MSKYRRSVPKAPKFKVEPVQIPAWPHRDDNGDIVLNAETGQPECTYYVRDMPLGDRGQFNKAIAIIEGDNVRPDVSRIDVELLVRTLCDDEGGRLFQDDEIGVVASQPADTFDGVLPVARRLNGLDGNAKN